MSASKKRRPSAERQVAELNPIAGPAGRLTETNPIGDFVQQLSGVNRKSTVS